MDRSTALTRKKQETARELLSERWNFAAGLGSENDRAVAVMAAAFLDDALYALLSRSFVEDKIADQLLKSDRPLGTFSARIKPLGRNDSRGVAIGGLYESKKRPVRPCGSHDDGIFPFVNTADDGSTCSALHAPCLLVSTHLALRSRVQPCYEDASISSVGLQQSDQGKPSIYLQRIVFSSRRA
jgi:hypothetical protein